MRQPTPDQAKLLLSFMPSRPDYETWIKIISAIGNTFDYYTALNLLLSRFKDEKPNEHALKLNCTLKNISFATLIYYAKQHGYKAESRPGYSLSSYKAIESNEKDQLINFDDIDKSILYKFKDESIEERIAIMQYDGNLSRLEAERIILSEKSDSPKERVYRIAVNSQVKDKTKEYKKLNECFNNSLLTAKQIAEVIAKGHSIICAKLKSDNKGNIKRNNESWKCSELIALDIDTGLTIDECFKIPETKHALLIYTSPSHTQDKSRFRILFDLPYLETNNQRYSEILSKFIQIYKADKQCKDIARIYFGNTNAVIHSLRTNEVLKFKNGVLFDE